MRSFTSTMYPTLNTDAVCVSSFFCGCLPVAAEIIEYAAKKACKIQDVVLLSIE